MAPRRILRRWLLALALAVSVCYLIYRHDSLSLVGIAESSPWKSFLPEILAGTHFSWADVPIIHPDTSHIALPVQASPAHMPSIQVDRITTSSDGKFPEHDKEREVRRAAVKEAFVHSWNGYRKHAWMHDEIAPLSDGFADPFGGWAATLVDSLDTLWIMGMKAEFEEAVEAAARIDFSQSELYTLSVFETTIRFLGGFLGAYDVSLGKYPILRDRAIELGEMLYHAFDTENRMPVGRWDWSNAKEGGGQSASSSMLVAELGSLTMEFTRLSQITGNDKYFSAVQRISLLLHEKQNSTIIPGLWPVTIDARHETFDQDTVFTWGGMADSAFEYLPKMHLLLTGQDSIYKDMWNTAALAAKKYLTFEPLLPRNTAATRGLEPLFLGTAQGTPKLPQDPQAKPIVTLNAEGQHLTCFAGGAFALASRALSTSLDTDNSADGSDRMMGERLTDGCVWSYRSTPTGVGPEIFKTSICRKGMAAVSRGREPDWTGKGGKGDDPSEGEDADGNCVWGEAESERARRLAMPEGYIAISDPRYLLRPEAIESVFVLWRVTGDQKWADAAWDMFQAVTRRTRVESGYAAMANVMAADDADPADDTDVLKATSGRAGGAALSKTGELMDTCESFWTAETLKYFYLVFTEVDVVSLDEFVLNTEAHPFRWNYKS